MSTKDNPFFKPIGTAAEQTQLLPEATNAEADSAGTRFEEERPLQEVESLCMVCGQQGITRMLLTFIPYFREVIVMSFRCDHCGNSNNEIQSASTIREHGVIYTVKVLNLQDLNRQIVKSETCSIVIPDFELTIPPHQGQLTTIEGLLRDTVQDLSADQPLRRVHDESTWEKIEALISKLKEVIPDDDEGDSSARLNKSSEDPIKPFTLIVNDPTGNSFVEFIGSMADPKWSLREYTRTVEQNLALGLSKSEEEEGEGQSLTGDPSIGDEDASAAEEVYVFPGICSSCGRPVDTRMKRVNIPYFKDVLIMSTNCPACGYRDNEVKSGGAISDLGKKITLHVEDAEDLSRDILKSETCGLIIPEIELSLHAGTLGGRFTTVEGILSQVYDELNEKVFRGDSVGSTTDAADNGGFERFLSSLKEVMTASRPFTLILDDPLANSYLQNLYAPDPDPNMDIVTYKRTWEQDEELGLNDIKVEGYSALDGIHTGTPEQGAASEMASHEHSKAEE